MTDSVRIRRLALERGLTLSKHGLFRVEDESLVVSDSEQTVYAERRDLVVLGPVEVGKTFIGQRLGHIACRRRHTTLMARPTSSSNASNPEPLGEWLAAMADPLLAEAAIDRLTSNAYQDRCRRQGQALQAASGRP